MSEATPSGAPKRERQPRAGRENDTRSAKDARRALKKYRVALSGAAAGTPEEQARDQLLYANTMAMIDLADALRANSSDDRD